MRLRRLPLGLLAALALGAIAVAGCGQTESPELLAADEPVPTMESVDHVVEGEDPGPYNSNPPTSGPHYGRSLEPGFYDQAVTEQGPPHPEGYLVHNLEHGYVIFWFNCDALEGTSCQALKDQIQSVMDEYDGDKLIAFPWDSIDEAVVMTSWGHRMAMPTFDPAAAGAFIERNRYHAPEPRAP